MATLKYRKSRKNKKQLKKKKRTYKKRKTTRRKKGGTDDENVLPYYPYREEVFDPKNLDHITTYFTTSTNIGEQLDLLEKAENKKDSGCTREYYTTGLLSSKKYNACEKKKVENYCAILIELNDMIEKLNNDNRIETRDKELINNEFYNYKQVIEDKIRDHGKKAKINLEGEIFFKCEGLKLQKEKEEKEKEQEQEQEP